MKKKNLTSESRLRIAAAEEGLSMFPASSQTEPQKQLIKALKESEEALRLYIYRQCRDLVQTEDILQKVYLFIWERQSQWDPKTPLLKWAYSIAYFTVKSHYRDQGREPVMLSAQALQLVAQESEIENDELAMARQKAMQGCLKNLSDKDKQLLQARYWENQQVMDIAETRNTNANTVAQKLRRIRQRLQNCIEYKLKSKHEN